MAGREWYRRICGNGKSSEPTGGRNPKSEDWYLWKATGKATDRTGLCPTSDQTAFLY